jgi:ABC-type nitrate/sulfonate/bicarbonate transport system substrate-binding protein
MVKISRPKFLSICALLALSFGARIANAEMEKLHLGYSIYAGVTAPLWVAKEAGWFEKNGLSVDLIYFKGGTEAAQALIAGDVPIAMLGGSAVISSNLAGSGNVILAGLENTISFKLVTSKDITTPLQLRKKKLGVASIGGSTYLATVLALAHFGIKPDEVTILAIGSPSMRLAALSAGSIQGTVILPPETLLAKKMGLTFLVDMAQLGIEFQSAAIAAGKSILERRPDTVKRFVKAIVEGIHTYRTDQDFSLRVLKKYLKTDDLEVIEETYRFYVQNIPKKPYPTMRGIQAVIDQIARRNPKAGDSKPSQFVNVSFLKELDESGYIDRLYKKP